MIESGSRSSGYKHALKIYTSFTLKGVRKTSVFKFVLATQ